MMRASSVARTTLLNSGHFAARFCTRTHMGMPKISASGLPGKREESYLAGMIA